MIKNSKAPGSSNILPEMVKAGASNMGFAKQMMPVWDERKVPKEWVNAILIFIPKKGSLRSCDDWWGVALLEVVEKV